MTKQEKTELKWVADHMKTDQVQASQRFEKLVREISQADRKALRDTLQEMLADCR